MAEPYYLSNFNLVVEAVRPLTAGWWDAAEERILEAWDGLPEDARALYVRLFLRRGEVFRCDRLADDLKPSLELLCKAELATHEIGPQHATDLARHLPIAQLREWLGLTKASRADCARHLAANWLDASFHIRAIPWVRVIGFDLFSRFTCVFFGSRRQDLTEFVKTHLGHVQYPNYEVSGGSRFPCREDLETYLWWQQRRDDLTDGLLEGQEQEVCREARKTVENGSASSGTALRCWLGIARQYERSGMLQDAQQIYQTILTLQSCGEALERLSILKERSGDWRSALETLEAVPIERLELSYQRNAQKRISRLRRRLGLLSQATSWARSVKRVKLHAQPSNSYQGAKALYVRGDSQLTIESWVLERYRDRGYCAVLAENSYIQSLVGYLAWDVVFAPCPGAFFHPFQSQPADLGTKGFCARRPQAWSRLREQISSASPAELRSLLEERLDRYRNTYSTLTHMRYEAADFEPWFRLSVPTLARIIERVLDEFATLRRGFPDLIIWNDSEWRLVEVKGPRDRVSASQQIWHDYLLDLGIQVEVVQVRHRETQSQDPLQRQSPR